MDEQQVGGEGLRALLRILGPALAGGQHTVSGPEADTLRRLLGMPSDEPEPEPTERRYFSNTRGLYSGANMDPANDLRVVTSRRWQDKAFDEMEHEGLPVYVPPSALNMAPAELAGEVERHRARQYEPYHDGQQEWKPYGLHTLFERPPSWWRRP